MEASPGRVTVYIWSNVRSVKLCKPAFCFSVTVVNEWRGEARATDVCWAHDVVAGLATQPLTSSGRDFGSRAMSHHKVCVEPERSVEDYLKARIEVMCMIWNPGGGGTCLSLGRSYHGG